MDTDPQLTVADEADHRLSNRILKTKQNALNVHRTDQSFENSLSHKSNNSKLADRTTLSKENHNSALDKYSYNSGTSLSGSVLSASSVASTSVTTSSTKAVIIKEEKIVFPEAAPSTISKAFIRIHNREEKARELQIINLIAPFHCKYFNKNMKIDSNHYVKLPIEFRPRVKGEYVDKILIRVDGYENPLTCLIKAKCV